MPNNPELAATFDELMEPWTQSGSNVASTADKRRLPYDLLTAAPADARETEAAE